MPAIVDYPQVIHEALKQFGPLFANEPQRQPLAEYLTGLFVAERKDVTAIHREFAQATDPSCRNRFLTEADWDASALNEARLDGLQQDPDTRSSDRGSIPLDNPRFDLDGKLIEDVGWSWDHAEARSLIAHDYRIANYVCPSGKHYPLKFRRFKKRAQCEAEGVPFTDHTELCLGMGDCPLRSGQGQTRHLYRVLLAYSLLMRQLRCCRAWEGGVLLADDHRPSLSGHRRRDPAYHPRLGHLPGLRAGPRRTGRLRGLGPCQC